MTVISWDGLLFAMKIELNKADVAELKILLAGVKNGAPKVLTRAINKTLTGTRTQAKREIVKRYNLTQKRVNQDFRTNKASWLRLTGGVVAKGKPLGLTSFMGTKQTKKGVTGKILKEKPRYLIKSAFLARAGITSTATGEKPLQAFRRFGKARYPIERLTGPRIEDEFAKPRTYNAVTKYAQERIVETMSQELNYELSKL